MLLEGRRMALSRLLVAAHIRSVGGLFFRLVYLAVFSFQSRSPLESVVLRSELAAVGVGDVSL